MPKKTSARQDMITATRELLESQGVSATGMLDIVAAAEAPRGSIYHHFPGGKDELVVAAIEEAAALAESAIIRAGQKGGTPAEIVSRIAGVFRYAPEKADWRTGCPVAATAMEGHRQGTAVRAAVESAFSRWSAAVAKGLINAGMAQAEADRLAMSVISSLEGALILARGLHSSAPYDATVELLVNGLQNRARHTQD